VIDTGGFFPDHLLGAIGPEDFAVSIKTHPNPEFRNAMARQNKQSTY